MSRPLAAGLLVFLAAVGAIAAQRQTRALTIAQDRAATALALADSATAHAALLRRVADVAEHKLDSVLVVAAVASQRAVVTRVVYRDVRATAPDTCAPLIVAADGALAAQDSVATDLRAALQIAQEAANASRADADTLRPALARLRVAAISLTRAARPSLLARLTPHPGIGIAAGVDPLGRPTVVAGITFGVAF